MTPLSWLALALILAFVATLAWLVRRPGPSDVEPTPDRAPFDLDFVEVGPWRLRVHRSGTGPAVLLLHGLGANLYCWRALVEHLAPDFTVIAPDLPGFGQSTILDDAGYGLDDQVPRLISLLDLLGVGAVHVVGNSMGGNLAMWLALRHPERVKSLAVIAPAASPRLVPPGLVWAGWAAHPLAFLASRLTVAWIHGRVVSRPNVFDRERIDEALKTYGRQHRAVRALIRATAAIRDARLPGALTGIKAKTLILWGSRDRLVSRVVIDALMRVLPEAEAHVHLGGGHHLQEDEPEWTAEKLTRFFAEVQD